MLGMSSVMKVGLQDPKYTVKENGFKNKSHCNKKNNNDNQLYCMYEKSCIRL